MVSVKITLIGVGQAGGRLVDTFLDIDDWIVDDPVEGACVIDTSQAYLERLSAVPDAQRHLMGTHQAKGHGVGSDNELAATIARTEKENIITILDGLPIAESDAVLTLAGLGGGTGSGMTPVIAETVRDEYEIPVYSLGILPHNRASPIQTINAAKSLRSLRQQTDHLFLFDNDVWAGPDPDKEVYQELNKQTVTAIGTLLAVVDQATRESGRRTDMSTEDGQGILSTNAFSAIGFATGPTTYTSSSGQNRGLLDRLWPMSAGEATQDTAKADESIAPIRRRQVSKVLSEAASPPYTLPVDSGKDRTVGLFVIAPEPYLSDADVDAEKITTVGHVNPTYIAVCEPLPAGVSDRVSAICVLTDDSFDRVAELIRKANTLQRDPSWTKEAKMSDQLTDTLENSPTDSKATTTDEDDDPEPLF